MGCTSRPDLLDSALLRPGRFDKLVHVSLPSRDDRAEFIQIEKERMPLSLDAEEIGRVIEATTAFSFADMKGLLRASGLCALRRDIETEEICFGDVFEALKSFSVHPHSRELLDIYKRMEDGAS